MDDEGQLKSKKDETETEVYTLKLYVAGRTKNCLAAYVNLRNICKERLAGKCRIEVVDLWEKPSLAKDNQIVAIPTLVRKDLTSEWRVVGDLSNTERVLSSLDLTEENRYPDNE